MKKFIFMIMATMIATVSISAQHVVESKAFDNTYVSVSVGGTVQTPLFEAVNDLNKVRPVIGVEIGKDLTTLYGTSIEGKGTFNNKGIHTIFDDFSIVWNHKLNLSNAIWGFNPDRKWEVKTVGGLGWGHDNGCVVDNYLVAEASAEVSYNISDKWAFNMNPTFVWNHAEHGLNVNHSEMELSVGFTYKIGKNFTRCNISEVIIERDFLNEQVNELRVKAENLEAEVDAKNKMLTEKDNLIAELNARKMTTNKIVVPADIGFTIGKSELMTTSKGSLVNLAKFLKDNEELNVEVVGFADAKTGTAEFNKVLSEKRAETVKQFLVDNGVAANRITTVGKGDVEQPFEENDVNRTVITIVK
jgi:outer membrane protein OmpA-like peptidoglycan-associated protein